MKIIVNPGRTVHIVKEPAVKLGDGSFSRPIVKAYLPTHRTPDLPEADAKLLIARGFGREDKPAPPPPNEEAEKKGGSEKK